MMRSEKGQALPLVLAALSIGTLVITPDFPAYDLLNQRPEFADLPSPIAEPASTSSVTKKEN